MFFNHPRIKIKILISQFLAIVPFIIFIFVLFDLWYDTRRSLIFEQNLSTAKLYASYISKNNADIIGLSGTLTSEEVFNMLLKSDYLSDKNKLKAVLKSVSSRHKDIDSVNLFSPDGSLIESSLDYDLSKSQTSILDRGYFQQLVKSKKTVVSDPLVGRLSGKSVYLVASPLVIDGNIEYIVLISVEIDSLKKYFENALTSKNRLIIVTDSEDNIVFTLNSKSTDNLKTDVFKENYHIKIARSGSNSIIDSEKLPLSEKLLLGYAVPASVNGFNWTVISADSLDEVYLPIIKTQSFFWLILLASTLFALSVVSFFLRKIKIIY